jgi:hypothetical protein
MNRLTIAMTGFAFGANVALGVESSVPFIHADAVPAQGITGRGVTVVVIDDGIDYTHPGLAGSIADNGVSIVNMSFTYDGGAALPGRTHGTTVSLIITDPTGVAPNARILPIRVVNAAGGGTPVDIRLAVEYATACRMVDRSVRVINISLAWGGLVSCPCDVNWPFHEEAISEAADAGIITFAGTGNEASCGYIGMPACVSSAVPVAANYDDDYGSLSFGVCDDFATEEYRVTCFSNLDDGCSYLLAAPGYDIAVGGFPGEWGTSYATPHCSGVAALMFEKNRCGSLDAYAARSAIFNAATVHDFAYPYCPISPQPRHVNALAAVNQVGEGSCGFAGDLDCDGKLDVSDWDLLMECMSGPGPTSPLGGLCTCADFLSRHPTVMWTCGTSFSFSGRSPDTARGRAATPMEPAPTMFRSTSAPRSPGPRIRGMDRSARQSSAPCRLASTGTKASRRRVTFRRKGSLRLRTT